MNKRIIDLQQENSDLRSKLDQKNYTRTYKENKRLELEIKNMYILQEENNDLREDLERLKNLSYE